ncbi:GxxExxY protein [Cnuella takakiae]|uniref:GxxExxY protein n=1 Tax=Cnuella takakiae TaxID=1302690 RepID=A0A1M5HZH2_9BACT|nr:GxxExxY protein [Cnuella takakiae]OLY91404.1 GxxExxY protein [Cnuella takakiae]SHG21193.1 GxxExxY protein [Cnuella takakiae]
MIHQNLTDQIIKAFYTVYNELGYGFLEKVYENALFLELQSSGLTVMRQMPIDVFYHKTKVGTYYADLCVENKVIIELKAAEGINKEHEHQLLNYLKATCIEVGLLLNFGIKPELKRKIFENRFKNPFSSVPSV